MTKMNKNFQNIGVFFGSGSPEHDVSIITGQLIVSTLKKLGYQVTPVYITKDGKWMLGEELGSIKVFADPAFAKATEGKPYRKYTEYYLDLEQSIGKMVFRRKGLMGKSISIDLAFPALHGSYGEDGTIQGLFEMFGIPYVGCGVPASAIAMDKALTKIMMSAANIPTTKFIWFERQDWEKKGEIISKIKNDLTWPVFVKPVHLGSSIGIGKAKDGDLKDLEFKIEVALHYDGKVLVEEGVENVMDVTCCVIGNTELIASNLQESIFGKDLLDFDAKYLEGGGAQTGQAKDSVVIPARLDEVTTKAIQETAKQVYKALGCQGIARVDFLYDKSSGKLYANEVNPLPGTLYNHLWKASGIETEELVEKLIKYAKETYEEKRKVTYTFESNILKQLNSSKLGGSKLK
jgi:D-alanine-D-alanine ligase